MHVPSKIIQKIAKLLRLAGKGETPEERVALKMATALQDEYRVDVDLEDDAAHQGGDRQLVSLLVPHIHCLSWRVTLLSVIGRKHGCETRCTRDLKADSPRYFLWISGPSSQVTVTRMHYQLLSCHIERMARSHLPAKMAHVYALGIARFIVGLMEPTQAKSSSGIHPEVGYGPGPELDPEPDALTAETPAGDTVALAIIPRQRITVPRSEVPPRPQVSLEFDLPEATQRRGSMAASGSFHLIQWAKRFPSILLEHIQVLERVPKRIRGCLLSSGIHRVGDLVFLRRSELLSIRGIGEKSVSCIEEQLHRHAAMRLRSSDPFDYHVEFAEK